VPEIDLWLDKHEPVVKPAWRTFCIRIPNLFGTVIYLDVDDNDYSDPPWETQSLYMIQGFNERISSWFGKRVDKMTYDERKEIWEWLTEWELVVLRKIGPEDSEYFATDKLLQGAST
jgi:hypothetical protein